MTTPEEVRVYPRHIRAAGMCLIPGAKEFFASHGLDWREFMKNGLPVSQILATGDALAEQVAKIAQDGR